MIASELNTKNKPNWCPACGNYSLFESLKRAIVSLNLLPEQVLVTYGIGCHGHMVNFLAANGFEGLHGRPLPVAIGAKIANHNLTVIASSGDGDAYGEGLAHLINAARTNHDVTLIVHNNWSYSLTTGQTSPTTPKGEKTKSTPQGSLDTPLNPLVLALVSGATFVSRSFTGDIQHLSETIAEAIKHKGFSLVDILQPCAVFRPEYTVAWFKERVRKIETNTDYEQALKLTHETEKFPLGILYQTQKPSYEQLLPQLEKQTLLQNLPKVENLSNLLEQV